MTENRPLALITGASRGLGYALAQTLTERGWNLLIDGRDADALTRAAASVRTYRAIPGDVADPEHRAALVSAVEEATHLDLLVNNASTLGASPLPWLGDIDADVLQRVFDVNVVAPVALTRSLLPHLVRSRGTVVNISSDAARGAYEGWGGYGSSKAALDQVTAILGVEQADIQAYAFDPGDMRTQMHAEAFPGEDISDRPLPETVVPSLLRLFDERPPSGRYRASELVSGVVA